MYDPNPTQTQFAPPFRHPTATPLILIHDGGGTTFGYFSLQSLYRDVYTIHNPHYSTGEPWEGGIDEMAQHYIQLLSDAGISGKILLGGWSIGGLLALTIARMLAVDDESGIFVAGLLIIDTCYHIPWSKYPFEPSEPDLPNVPDLVLKSLDNCNALLNTWELPAWDPVACQGRNIRFTVDNDGPGKREITIPAGHVYYKPLQGESHVVPVERFGYTPHDAAITNGHATSTSDAGAQQQLVPPSAVLLRCNEYAPTKDPSGAPARMDSFRDKMMLGWDENYPEFIKAVIDMDAHHYNIFDLKKISETTAQINDALGVLETYSTSVA